MREQIGTAELAELVSDKVTALQSDKQTFTAFDVTQQLRSENPDLEIEHSEVRPLVRTSVDLTAYETQTRTVPSGATAIEYVPVSVADPNTMTSYQPGMLGSIFGAIGWLGPKQAGSDPAPSKDAD